MNKSLFPNLKFCCVYYCYSKDSGYSSSDLDAVKRAVAPLLDNYVVEPLATDSKFCGALVARRFNLGVVSDGYGVLVVPSYSFSSFQKGVASLAKGLSDVESFRNEPDLFIGTDSLGNVSAHLSDAVVSPSSGCEHHSHKSYDDIISKVYLDKRKRNLGFIIQNFELDLPAPKETRHDDSFRRSGCDDDILECDGAILEMPQAESAEVLEKEDSYVDETDTILSEQEALVKKIADLIRLYVMRYGTIDNEKIQLLLRGKMTLSADGISTLVVNKNCEIILRDVDELPLKLGGPINASLYILFLRHPDGFSRRDLQKMERELLNIYSILAPNFNTDPVRNLIESDSRVNQAISKINKLIKSVLPVGDKAEVYCIKGERGKNYKVGIASMPGKVQIMPKF